MTKPIALRLCLGENSDSEIKRVLFLVYPNGAVKHYGGGTYAGVVQVAKEKHAAAATYTLELAADMRHVLVEAPVREVLFADCRSWGAVLDWFRERVGEPLDGSTLIDTESHGGALGDADHFAAARLTELERQATAAAATTVRFTLQAPADLQTAEEVDRFWTSYSPIVPGTTVNLELPRGVDWRRVHHAGARREIRCRNYTEGLGRDAAGFGVHSVQYTPGIRGGYVHLCVEWLSTVDATLLPEKNPPTPWAKRGRGPNEKPYVFGVVLRADAGSSSSLPGEPALWHEYAVFASSRWQALARLAEDFHGHEVLYTTLLRSDGAAVAAAWSPACPAEKTDEDD